MNLDFVEVAALALAGLLSLVGLRLVYVVLMRFVRPSLYIEAVSAATDEDAKGLSDMIRSELHALREEGGGAGLHLVTAPDTAVDLGAITSVSTELQVVNALLSLLPGRTRLVSASLQSAGLLGQGMSVSIRNTENRIGGSVTIWENSFAAASEVRGDRPVDGPEHLDSNEVREMLTIAASAWIAYRALQGASVRQRSALLTQDWESYALFRVGARQQQAGALLSARRLYLQALERDPRNRGALFNLAVLDLRDLDEPPAIERLDLVIDEIVRADSGDDEPWRFDRLWYRAVYNRAVARLHRGMRRSKGLNQDERASIKNDLRDVAEAADLTIALLGGQDAERAGGRFADLVRFLVEIRSAAVVTFADVATEGPSAA